MQEGHYLDLTRYSTLILKINASKNVEQVQTYIRNYDPDYATAPTGDSLTYSVIKLNSNLLDQKLEIPLTRFEVAHWWLNRYGINRADIQPDFSTVHMIGIDVLKVSDDKSALMEIETLELEGVFISRENWYLFIAVFWISYILFKFINSSVAVYRQAKSAQDLIDSMTKAQSSLIQENRQYKNDSINDPLTEIYNRRGLVKAIQRLQGASRKDEEHSVIVLDIDYFKRINDNFGHDVGDKVIKKVAKLCASSTRGHDIVSRWGGEEFIIVCAYCRPEHAFIVGEKIREELANNKFSDPKEFSVTLSCGISSYKVGEKFDEAFKRADDALLRAKQEGRNQTIISSI